MKHLPLNTAKPLIMHIDLNSCFASIEQQANPLLRNRPVVVAAYATPKAFILSPSIEAKKIGIKMGMTVAQAREVYPKVTVLTPDAPKYRDVHIRFRSIFQQYSPKVTPKSIDEAVLDFSSVIHLYPDLERVGKLIKNEMKEQIGAYVPCSIGIGPNRFLAKLAASYKKPDGLTTIDHTNLEQIYTTLDLIDFHGINVRYQARLNYYNIYTPMQFYAASSDYLAKQVFKSVVGRHWYMRLRGWEVDDREFEQKSISQQYALGRKTNNPILLSRLLMKLCEKMGRRLRKGDYSAQGIHIGVGYADRSYWHMGKKFSAHLYTTQELYRKAWLLFNRQPQPKVVSQLNVTCFDLISNSASSQMCLFDDNRKLRKVSDAMDRINDRYGEYVIAPALIMDMEDTILDRIAFGRIRELEYTDVAYTT